MRMGSETDGAIGAVEVSQVNRAALPMDLDTERRSSAFTTAVFLRSLAFYPGSGTCSP